MNLTPTKNSKCCINFHSVCSYNFNSYNKSFINNTIN